MVDLLFLTTVGGVLVPLVVILALVLILRSDGDLTLMLAEKFGKDLGKIRGRIVWITGASTGIGEALAMEAAHHGAKLVLSARSEDLLEKTKQKCKEAGCPDEDVLVLPLDITRLEDHAAALERVLQHFGQVDVLVHNAGRSQRAQWEKIDLQVDRDMFELNVFGPVNLSRLVYSHFAQNGHRGHFVIMSSVAGVFGVPFSGSYTASKHAINGYFESLMIEKAGLGIDVTILCPGPVFSNLLQVAATEKSSQVLGKSMSPTDKRMATDRCAKLCLVAIVNKLQFVWIAESLILLLLYFNQFFPVACNWLTAFLGPKFFQKVRDSTDVMQKLD